MGACLGQHGFVHLVVAGGSGKVAAEDVVAADGVLARVARVLEERTLVPVLLQELPALLRTPAVLLCRSALACLNGRTL